MAKRTTCTVDGCDKVHQARGFCSGHYAEARRSGMALIPMHSMSNTDPATGLGTCAICGPNTPVRELSPAHPNGRCGVQARDRAARAKAARRDAYREYHRNYNFQARLALVRELLSKAGWRCEICMVPLDEASAKIDHDHACCPTSRSAACGSCYRGVLCHGCNVGLGGFRDDPAKLDRAMGYLERSLARK